MRNQVLLVVVAQVLVCGACSKKELGEPKGDQAGQKKLEKDGNTSPESDPYQQLVPQLVGQHQKGITHVSWSPDGQRLLSTGRDKLIKLWQAETSTLGKTFKGHKKSVAMATFSPDGKTIASASFDETARLWDVATGKQLKVFKERVSTKNMSDEELEEIAARPDPQMNWLAFSKDGKRLVTASDDFSLRFWDVQTGKLLAKALDEGCRQRRVYALPGNKSGWVSSSGCMDDGVAYLKFWDDAGNQQMVLGSENRDAHYLAFDPKQRFLVTADGSTFLTIYSFQGSYLKQLMVGTYHFCLTFSLDGSLLFVGTDADGIYVYQVDGFRRVGKLKIGEVTAIDSLDVNPHNSKLAVGTRNGKLWVYNDPIRLE